MRRGVLQGREQLNGAREMSETLGDAHGNRFNSSLPKVLKNLNRGDVTLYHDH